MREERRNYPRFNFENNIIAIGFGMVGKVTDASSDGIGVKYNKRKDQILNTTNNLQIFKIDKKGCLNQIEITAKIVSDIYLADIEIIYFHSRCGFQFVKFSEDQLFKLEYILDRPLIVSTSNNIH